ncbi:siroheme synthase [Pedobacter chinensis]|uniref:Probable membrane transporter protein n=1 Tax=Pedobacter chinensis TaxID=2282421 RepID=A0A369Q0R5_9SPHI|nr:TSUP family transporter [Pedobacter chinensis]RDC58334.1 siroheme synthase [Pedobacter chinensis]
MQVLPSQSNHAESFSEEEKGNQLFPVFIKLNKLHTLLIGAGNIGLEKLTTIVNNSHHAKITIVAEMISQEVYSLIENYPQIKIKQKSFDINDLNDIDIVFAATNNNILNEEIRAVAHEKGLLINVADKPELCDFYLGSIVKKGNLKIGISTNGKSPTIAKRLKEILDETIPPEIEQSIENLNIIRNKLLPNFKHRVKILNHLTESFAKNDTNKLKPKKILIWTFSVLALMVFGHIFFSFIPFEKLGNWGNTILNQVDSTIIYFIIGGFLAQLVDGALGMAYGVSATTFLLSFGVTPAAASASVHASEIFTSGVSGLMHLKFGNVRAKLFKKLLLPGILGAIAGAYILSSLENYGHIIKPIVSAYTLFLGVKILLKAVAKTKESKPLKVVGPLAFIGAFLDSIGGGGWGPIVTSTLISRGGNPRYTIGSVNLTEFFVTLASSITFIMMIGLTHWQIIAGLVLGGCIAAPFGAFLTKKLNVKTIMIMVGIIVIITSLRTIYVLLMKL